MKGELRVSLSLQALVVVMAHHAGGTCTQLLASETVMREKYTLVCLPDISLALTSCEGL